MQKNHSVTIKEYSLITLIDIRFGDPICAIALNERNVIIGTMLGKVTLFSLKTKQSQVILETSNENISGISFDSSSSFLVAIGDEEVSAFKLESLLSIPSTVHYKNYETEGEHLKYCDYSYVVLNKSVFFKIVLKQPEEGNVVIQRVNAFYEIKNLNTKSIRNGEIEMTNYVVPFDFLDDHFLWVEFLSDSDRNICLYTFPSEFIVVSSIWKFPLKKEFGHISHARIIHGTNKVFIVRNLTLCEIRDCDINFTCLYTFNHIGDEVIAMDLNFFIPPKDKISSRNSNGDIEAINEVRFVKRTTRPGNNNIIIDSCINKKEVDKDEASSKEENIEALLKDLKVVLLDIDGNINVLKKGKLNMEVNVCKVNGIKKENIERGLFALGYPYLIKCCNDIIAISCDFGCYVIAPF